MTTNTVIDIRDVGKKYCRDLEKAMLYGFQDTFFPGKGDMSAELRTHEYWALQDISLEVRRGECLGVIGPNGAGKSTLLKLLNRIILPNRGTVDITGHVCALIELGAGFHPALTGRENIHVQASILGLTRKEINNKLDDIIRFSELEEYIDMPVRFYSSGMHARLGFSIAMHTHPDVILVDEVLAVGDAGFRYKSYNAIAQKMQNAAVVLVSHNMEMITRLSDRVIVLDRGKMVFDGKPVDAVSRYQALFEQQSGHHIKPGYKLLDVTIHAESGCTAFGEPLAITIKIACPRAHADPLLKVNLTTTSGNIVAEYNNRNDGKKAPLQKGSNEIRIIFSALNLLPQKYYLSFTLIENGLEHIFWCRHVASVEVRGEQQGHQYYQLTSESLELNYG